MILYKRAVLLALICMGLELGSAGNLRAQVVVDGRSSLVGSDKPRILAAIAEPLITIPIIIDVARGELTVTRTVRSDGLSNLLTSAYITHGS